MKKIITFLILASVALTPVAAQSLRGHNMNGTTGLVSIPTGYIGWGANNKFAIDFGYRAVIHGNTVGHIPSVAVNLFNVMEMAFAFDFQPKPNNSPNEKNNDILTGIKFQLPTKNTFVALGTNLHFINIGDNDGYAALQPYLALTYGGNFFNSPAETTIVIGKTFNFNGRPVNSDIDFGMGFDLTLFPDVFNNALHWIIDFSNFGYSAEPHGVGGDVHRGILNMALRINMSAIPIFSKFKFIIDLNFNDIFDTNRSFSFGVVFGVSFI